MTSYIGIIHKDPGSDYGVSFPDFPGCISAGADLDEARAMAQEALALHVEGMIEDGAALPEPSSLERVMNDPNNRTGVAVLIPAPEAPDRAVRINITLPERLLRRIDEHTGNRSRFLADAAAQALLANIRPDLGADVRPGAAAGRPSGNDRSAAHATRESRGRKAQRRQPGPGRRG
jgi:predicted RNase H-like HicB family nuclease